METYHIAVYDAQVDGLDFAFLYAQMTQTWPAAHITATPIEDMEGYTFWWTIIYDPAKDADAESPIIVGKATSDMRLIKLYGDFPECIEFACWLMTLFPRGTQFQFRDAEDTVTMMIDVHTTHQTLMTAFIPALSELAWQILELLDRHDGRMPLRDIIAALQDPINAAAALPTIEQLDRVISDLWWRDYVSSPGVKWLAVRPERIDGLVLLEEWRGMILALVGFGVRAVQAKRMAADLA